MDPELGATIGAILGGAFTAGLLVIGLGWKLYQAIKGIAKTTGVTSKGIVAALGEEPDPAEPEPRSRPHTGKFQSMLRTELAPIHALALENATAIKRSGEMVADLAAGQERQGELIAELAAGQSRVATRTAEHSAKLHMADASDTMTSGRPPG